MPFYGSGAVYDNEQAITQLYVRYGVAALGWACQEAPTHQEIFRSIKVGNIIYLREHPSKQELIIKAIGIVFDNEIRAIQGIGEACILVRWLWQGNEIFDEIIDKYNIRNLTSYEEHNPAVKRQVLELLLSKIPSEFHWPIRQVVSSIQLNDPIILTEDQKLDQETCNAKVIIFPSRFCDRHGVSFMQR